MKPHTHVLHLLPNLNIGGMENGIVNVANRIDRSRFKISICCLNSLGPMVSRIEPGAASVSCLGQGAGKSPSLVAKLFAILRRQRVDILHTHNYYTGMYGIPAARLAGVRVVHGQHCFMHDADSHEILKRRYEVALCRMAHHVCCVSQELKETVCSDFGISPRKVTTILNGVDFGRFRSDPARRATTRAALGLADTDIVVGSVGRLHYQKNYDLLMSVAGDLFRTLPGRLLLVGGGPETDNLKNLAISQGRSDRIRLTGERSDVPDLMRAMDIFVLPSRFEGLPNTVLEAMCAGLPVIASRVGEIPSIVEDHRSGLLFASGDAPGLSEALRRLLVDESLRRDLGARGQAIAQERFTMERMVAQYERLYDMMLEQENL